MTLVQILELSKDAIDATLLAPPSKPTGDAVPFMSLRICSALAAGANAAAGSTLFTYDPTYDMFSRHLGGGRVAYVETVESANGRLHRLGMDGPWKMAPLGALPMSTPTAAQSSAYLLSLNLSLKL